MKAEHTIDVLVGEAYAEQLSAGVLHSIAEVALQHQRIVPPTELAVVVTGDQTLQELNRRHRGIDAPTDVLAFPNAVVGTFVEPPGQTRHLGDVVISYPQAKTQAEALGHSVTAEVQLLTVHGILHLLGHDDGEETGRAAMWAAQREILAAMGIQVTVPD